MLKQILKWHKKDPNAVHLALGSIALFLCALSTTLAVSTYAQFGPPPGPSVTVTAPTAGFYVAGASASLAASTSGGSSTALQFVITGGSTLTVDGSTSDAGSTWTANFDSTGLTDGDYAVVASSTIDGANVTSDPVNFHIDNSGLVTVTMALPNDGDTMSGNGGGFGAFVVGANADGLVFHVTGPANTDLTAFYNPGFGAWVAVFDTGTVPDGNYTVVADADVGGTHYTSPSIHVIVSNAAYHIDSPATGAFSGSVDFVLTAPPGVQQEQTLGSGGFELRVSGGDNVTLEGWGVAVAPHFDSGTGKWLATIDTTNLPDGTYTAQLSDTAPGDPNGGTFKGDPITMTVSNAGIHAMLQQSTTIGFIQNGSASSVDYIVDGVAPIRGISGVTLGVTFWHPDPSGLTSLGKRSVFIRAIVGGVTYESPPTVFDFGSPPPVETSVLSVSMSFPANGATVSGTVPLILAVTPSAAKAGFDIYKNNTGLPTHVDASLQSGSWVAQWDTTKIDPGSYSIQAIAQNAQGNPFRSLAVAVTVVKTSSPTAPATTSTLEVPLIVPPLSNPAFDPTATGTYSADAALAANPTIDIDLGIPAAGGPTLCRAGSLLKLHDDGNPTTDADTAVYYCGADGKRYVFTNDKVFFSWYSDFSSVVIVDADTMASIPLGGDITYRPGSRLIKIQTDPKVYAISRGGLLRWVSTEDVAKRLFGLNWNTLIDDVSDAFFVNYQFGDAIR